MNREWPPIILYKVHFQFPESDALPLMDPITDEELGAWPEWIKGVRDEPVAYVKGSTPSVRVTLMTQFLFVPERFVVRAEGPPLEESSRDPSARPIVWIPPQAVDVTRRAGFFEVPESLPFGRALPDRIGKHTLQLRWIATWTQDGKAVEVIIGETQHTVCTTWKKPIHDERLKGQTYTPLMLWTSEWCAGLRDRKAICDAIMAGLPSTNLRYGVPGWEVRYMFMTGGGMCGGWYQIFRQMAGCQGVHVEGRTFRPRYEKPQKPPSGELPEGTLAGDSPWVAFACTSPGLNQPQPSWLIRFRADFPVEMEAYPPRLNPLPGSLCTKTENRYCFPIDGKDGHCINFLVKDEKTVYLYDPSFKNAAIEIDMPLPDADTVQDMDQDAPFRSQYLDGLFTWFLMTTQIEGVHAPVDLDKRKYGLSILTTLIPKLSIQWGR